LPRRRGRLCRDISVDDAVELARRSIYHATFRDAVSGGTVSGMSQIPYAISFWLILLGSSTCMTQATQPRLRSNIHHCFQSPVCYPLTATCIISTLWGQKQDDVFCLATRSDFMGWCRSAGLIGLSAYRPTRLLGLQGIRHL
jgi:hypothetical protein